MWATRDRNGNSIYTRDSPSNPASLATHNSTLRWLKARCNGARFPGRIPCQTGPLTNLKVSRCTRIPPPLNPNPPRDHPCCHDVCTLCVVNVANHWSPIQTQAVRLARRKRLCARCQLYEARRHPDGHAGCICRSLLREGWMCWSCRHETIKQIKQKTNRQMALISNLHRDRQGRKISDPNRAPASNALCPGCARSFVNSDRQVSHVTYCMSCNGVVVKPSLGPDYHPTTLMPVRSARWSLRIAAKYAAMPPLDFTPIVIPRR